MKKTLIIALSSLLMFNTGKAEAVITSFTAVKTGDSLNFTWATSSENNMFYYEVMQVVNINGSEKELAHVDAVAATQTSGQTYSVNVAFSRALMVGFTGIFLLLLAGMLLGWGKTLRKLSVLLVCIMFFNISCKKNSAQPATVIGNPDVPGKSSATQGVFRLKSVDQNGNINYTGYIVLTY